MTNHAAYKVLPALLLCACGSSADTKHPDELAGSWQLMRGADCAQVLRFEGSEYSYAVACRIDATNLQAQKETGAYEAAGGTLTFSAGKTSCPGSGTLTGSADYSMIGADSLRLSGAAGAVVFVRDDQTDPTGIAIQYGCLDAATGTFTPHPLAPL